MTHSRTSPLDYLLFTLAVVIALGVRLLNLGAAPLTNPEAAVALQALDLSRSARPLYVVLTNLSFALWGSTTAVARLWPALAGSALVLIPLALRKKLGRAAALALAFGLALDPSLVAAARLAEGPMLALAFISFALLLAYMRQPAWSGICAGLALLAGPEVWFGLLALGFAWGVARLAGLAPGDDFAAWVAAPPQESAEESPLRTLLLFAAVMLILVGTRFFTYPAGLGALATALIKFLQGWVTPSGIPVMRVLIALGVYSTLGVLFAGVAIFSPRVRTRRIMLLGVWALTALLLTLVYPGRSVSALVWAVVPLWGLAAWALADGLDVDDAVRQPIAAGQALAWFVLLALAWMTLSSLHLTLPEGQGLRWLIILGVLLLGALSTAFVGLGWSWKLARSGTLLGLLAALAVYSLAVMTSATQTRPSSPAELWATPLTTGQAELFLATLHDLARAEHGLPTQLEVVSLVDTPVMRWTLRNFTETRYPTTLAEAELPPVVVAPQGSETAPWAQAYRGQDFAWSLSPGWEGALPTAWVDWLIFRQAPVQTEFVILWLRGDLFPNGTQPEEPSQ